MQELIQDSFTQSLAKAAKNILPDINAEDLGARAWEICEGNDLIYNVEKVPAFGPEGGIIPDLYTTRRQDPDGDGWHYFGPVGSDYTVLQNWHLAQLAVIISRKINAPVVSAGHFNKGALPYIQLDVGEITGIGDNKDTIKQFATLTSSHSLMYALRFGYSDLTISCWNTFTANNRIIGKQNSFRHTPNIEKRLKKLLQGWPVIQAQQTKATQLYAKMAGVKLTKQAYNKVLSILSGVKEDVLNDPAQRADVHPKTALVLDSVEDCLQSEIKQKGGHFWGLFAGATNYTSHGYAGEEENRLKEKFAGHLTRTDNVVFSELIDLAGLN